MKAQFLLLAVLLLALRGRMLFAELQGPLTINAKDTETAAGETTQATPTNAEEAEKSSSSGTDANEAIVAEASSNERKSANYATYKPPTVPVDMDMGQAPWAKALPTGIFERLYNEKLIKQKLKEQIDAIEAQRGAPADINPTPEDIEAQSLYEKALEMMQRQRADQQSAQSLMQTAADMKHPQARAALAWSHVLGRYEFDFDGAAKEFEDLAKDGVPEAHMGLAFLYSVGLGGKNVSQPLTLIHLTLAALGGDATAQMALGYRYSYGINVPMHCEKSLSYYKKVAKKVASRVTFSNGPFVHRVRLLDESENPGSQETEIVDYYQLLADKGDVQSQVGLGQLYYQGGKAIPQDHQKALEYFTQAANSGNAIGYAFLGKIYLEGTDFIIADADRALKYFKKAADLGDPVGQSGLGLMYLKGLGVPKDALKALNYFTQAADQGWVDGQLQLGNMYFTGNGVKTDYKLALKYFNLASQSGHVLAYYNLGIMHTYGMGMLRSCPVAVEFFKNVAERGRWTATLMTAYGDYKNSQFDVAYMQYAFLAELGYEVAQSNSAYLLDRGDITIFHDRHEELIRAFNYWKRSAAQGYSAAQVKLGDYYYYGWGTSKDFETAAALYRKASEQQYNAQAMFNLGYMHEQGLGMKKDWHLAKRLYDLAAETNADAKVPVAIALLKLQLLVKIEAIKESPYKFIFYMDENIAANWDLYMITILTLLLGFVMYTRRPYQQAQQPDNAAAAEGAAQANEEAPANLQTQANDEAPANLQADTAATALDETAATTVPASTTAPEAAASNLNDSAANIPDASTSTADPVE